MHSLSHVGVIQSNHLLRIYVFVDERRHKNEEERVQNFVHFHFSFVLEKSHLELLKEIATLILLNYFFACLFCLLIFQASLRHPFIVLGRR